MLGKNVVFSIVAPLILMAIIAVIVITIGETLLGVHEWAHEASSIGHWPSEEENKHWEEIANIYPVAVALAIALVILVGGTVATRLAPQVRREDSHHEASHH
jgi:NADH:ubiquinone oxidoreductase subunit 6 (subunit J)